MSARRFAGEVAALAGAGLGLRKGALRLERTTGGHVEAGEALARAVAAGVGAAVEHVGSTAVVGLLAKPIVDLAVAWPPDAPLEALHTTLAGWSYQGDSGDQGGHLFVLESEPWVRVSHLHAVDAGGRQWRRYPHAPRPPPWFGGGPRPVRGHQARADRAPRGGPPGLHRRKDGHDRGALRRRPVG